MREMQVEATVVGDDFVNLCFNFGILCFWQRWTGTCCKKHSRGNIDNRNRPCVLFSCVDAMKATLMRDILSEWAAAFAEGGGTHGADCWLRWNDKYTNRPPKGDRSVGLYIEYRFLSIFLDLGLILFKIVFLYMEIEPGWLRNSPEYF